MNIKKIVYNDTVKRNSWWLTCSYTTGNASNRKRSIKKRIKNAAPELAKTATDKFNNVNKGINKLNKKFT